MFAFFGLLCYNDMYAKNMCFSCAFAGVVQY